MALKNGSSTIHIYREQNDGDMLRRLLDLFAEMVMSVDGLKTELDKRVKA